jgi:hypothetical protein
MAWLTLSPKRTQARWPLTTKDKYKSKEALMNNKKSKIQWQIIDECRGPHHHPHPPRPQATQPQYHLRKEKVLGYARKQTTNKTKILKCSPRSMLPTTWVPRWVLNWRGFLVEDTSAEASSARVHLLLRGARGTRRGTYSTYGTVSVMKAPGRIVVAWDLLVEDTPARFSPAFTLEGLSSVGIRSMKFHPKSYR